MAKLTPDQIYAIARQAGFSAQAAVTMTAIAMGESGGRTEAHNPNPPDDSYGLWQINMLGSLGPSRLKQFGITSKEQLYDPLVNAKAAFIVSGGGGNFKPWTVYTKDIYRKYLSAAQDAARRVGDNVNDPLAGVIFSGPRGGVTMPQASASVPTSTATPQLTDEEAVEEIKAKRGALAWVLDVPELRALVIDAVKTGKSEGQLLSIIQNSQAFKTTTNAQRKWMEFTNTASPAEVESVRLKKFEEIKTYAAELGIEIPDARVQELADHALRLGWDKSTLDRAMAVEAHYKPGAPPKGDLGSTMTQYRQLAADYGIPLSEEQVFARAQRTLYGDYDSDNFQAELQDWALKRYSGDGYAELQKRIQEGWSVREWAGPYLQDASNLLERQVSLDDPAIQAVLNARDPETGDRRPMTLYEAQTYFRQRPEWEFTRQGRQKGAELEQQIGQMFGVGG